MSVTPMQPQPQTKRPRSAASWAVVVVLLYGLLLLVLTLPLALIAFLPGSNNTTVSPTEAIEIYIYWPIWLIASILALCQGALLVVPVRVVTRRPVSRRALLWPILASGFMFAALISGAAASFYEVWHSNLSQASFLIVLAATWIGWGWMFYRMGATREPASLIARQCQVLFRGSILELMIAVPCHVYVRHRNECCAGVQTFWGLSMGIAVMLFSFGPGVYFLYVDRWRRLQPRAGADAHEPAAGEK